MTKRVSDLENDTLYSSMRDAWNKTGKYGYELTDEDISNIVDEIERYIPKYFKNISVEDDECEIHIMFNPLLIVGDLFEQTPIYLDCLTNYKIWLDNTFKNSTWDHNMRYLKKDVNSNLRTKHMIATYDKILSCFMNRHPLWYYCSEEMPGVLPDYDDKKHIISMSVADSGSYWYIHMTKE